MADDWKSAMVENLELNTHEIEKRRTRLSSRPPFVGVDLIGICNMRPHCAMCLDWDGPKGPRHHSGMEVQDFLKLGEFFEKAWQLINCGIGEPLLHPRLTEILEFLRAKGKTLTFASNGLALDKAMAESLLPFSSSLGVVFSIDAASSETYSRLRADNFDEVIENIAFYCQKRGRSTGGSGKSSLLGAKTGLCFLPMKLNRGEVRDFVRLAARIGVDVVEFRPLNDVDHPVRVVRKGFLFDYQEQQLSDEELERIRLIAQEEADKCGVRFDCEYSIGPGCTHNYFVPEESRRLGIPCLLPWQFLVAYQNGDTIGCCYMTKSLGDWRRVGLEKLWNSTRMQKMRKELASGKLAKECLEYRSCPAARAWLERRTRYH